MQSADESLVTLLQQLLDPENELSHGELAAFAACWNFFSVKRKEMLTTAGDVEKHLYIVTSGVQRIYYYDEQEREATIVFTYEPSFGGVIDSFLLRNPSRYYYESLTASAFWRISHSELQRIMDEHPAIRLKIYSGITRAFSGALERLVELQCYSSEEKFRKLLTRSPHILQLIPHKYIANYLGINATNFSKLMNNIRL